MRVISAYGFGSSPENAAGEKMTAFLRSKGLLEGYGTVIPHYGFNNPSPSSGSPNYGYEIWAGVPSDVEPEGDLKVVMFEGGDYAVTRFENLENIGGLWGRTCAVARAQLLPGSLPPMVGEAAKPAGTGFRQVCF